MMTKDIYSVNEVASLLSLHVKTVRRYIREGKLKSTRVGKQYRISKADLDTFSGGALSSAQGWSGPVDVEVSSIVEINGLSVRKAERINALLTGAVEGRQEDTGLKVEMLFDEAKFRLKIIVLGSLVSTGVILGMVEQLAQTSAE